MKIILCLVLIFLFGAIGYGVSTNYLRRKKFFFELTNFLNYLKTEINFAHTRLEEVVNGYLCRSTSKDFICLLENYMQSIKEINISKENLFKNVTIVSEQERESIYLFFKGLGKMDVYNQLEEIENFINSSDRYYESTSEESGKYSALYTKLGIIVGAFLALIII